MSDALSPETLRTNEPSAVLHSVLVVVAAFATGIAFIILGSSILLGLGIVQGENSLGINLAGSILQFAGFGVVIWVYLEKRSNWNLIHISWPSLRDIGWIIGGLGILYLSVTILGIIISLFGQEPAQNAVVAIGEQNPVYFLYMIPVAIFLVGPAEEFLFRGIVQGLFRRSFGVIPAVLLASVMFGVVHVIALIGTSSGIMIYIAITVALGLILGAVYERTKNIIVPIAIHGFWNALIFVIQWLSTTGQIPSA